MKKEPLELFDKQMLCYITALTILETVLYVFCLFVIEYSLGLLPHL